LVVVILDGRVGPTVDEMVQLGYFATWMRWYMDTFGLMHLIDEPFFALGLILMVLMLLWECKPTTNTVL
jgi:hypothetical protein